MHEPAARVGDRALVQDGVEKAFAGLKLQENNDGGDSLVQKDDKK